MAIKTADSKTTTPAAAEPVPEISREERFAAWLAANQKLLLIALGILAVVVLAVWFMSAASARKERFAQSALEQAWTWADQGNTAQAAAELQRVVSNFPGTAAALEARLSLNQNRIQSGQAQLAVEDLRTFLAGSPPVRVRSAAENMLGVGLENTGQHAEAAQAYEASAQSADMPALKAEALVSAARAYLAAGNRDRAIAALRTVVDQYQGTMAYPIADMRLGELLKGA